MNLCGFEVGLGRPFFLIVGAPGRGGAQRLGREGRRKGPRWERRRA
jgi:hypothetical protein